MSPIATGLARATLGAPEVPRDGAVTPAEKRLSRPLFEAINIPHKKIQKICCIGAGYVGETPANPPAHSTGPCSGLCWPTASSYYLIC